MTDDQEIASPYAKHQFDGSGTNDSWSNLFAHVPARSRVLDVGCSTGNFGEALESRKGCTVVGVDVSEGDILQARSRLTQAEVLDVTVPGALAELGMFDVIVFADVLEHLMDPRAALLETAKQLNVGGIILYSIPNMAHLSIRLDLMKGQFGYTEVGILDHTHVHFYDRAAIESLFAECGLDIFVEHPVVIRYPRGWIEREFAAAGLTIDDEFLTLLARTDADVLQHVGGARAAIGGVPSESSFRERIFPPDEVSAYATVLESEVASLRRDNSELTDRLATATAATDELRNAQTGAVPERLRAHLKRYAIARARRMVRF